MASAVLRASIKLYNWSTSVFYTIDQQVCLNTTDASFNVYDVMLSWVFCFFWGFKCLCTITNLSICMQFIKPSTFEVGDDYNKWNELIVGWTTAYRELMKWIYSWLDSSVQRANSWYDGWFLCSIGCSQLWFPNIGMESQ